MSKKPVKHIDPYASRGVVMWIQNRSSRQLMSINLCTQRDRYGVARAIGIGGEDRIIDRIRKDGPTL